MLYIIVGEAWFLCLVSTSCSGACNDCQYMRPKQQEHPESLENPSAEQTNGIDADYTEHVTGHGQYHKCPTEISSRSRIESHINDELNNKNKQTKKSHSHPHLRYFDIFPG